MRKSAAEYIRQLEGRIARLERTAEYFPPERMELLRKLALHAYNMGQDVKKMSSPVKFPSDMNEDYIANVAYSLTLGLKWIKMNKEETQYIITSKGVDALLRYAFVKHNLN